MPLYVLRKLDANPTYKDSCVFPFIYKGSTYFSCIKANSLSPWCATRAVYDGNWKYCTKEGISAMVFGPPCHFPFNYKNKNYFNCTTKGSEEKILWCATSYNYDRDHTWVYC
ncbi:epididymal sperm-binding protein 1 [Trichechus manatus latirostris]|uniref:Epididymal sperm-binding protein 1 n=1 Tax=Trichechus manatus latirostris TaxID=127582 RepID=A0A2Y9G0U7_TRIMA|nr:epididymal sperm-binding protein 1 [Trichechus manatus latirostris]